jgi:choline dehydrogenase-like flavoprotein
MHASRRRVSDVPHELNCVEKYFKEQVSKQYKDRHMIIGRAAHITDPQQIHLDQGRAKCQHRTMCERGCPFGGYFSSNASTIPWAMKTGNMTLRPHSVVHSIIYDDKKQKASGRARDRCQYQRSDRVLCRHYFPECCCTQL